MPHQLDAPTCSSCHHFWSRHQDACAVEGCTCERRMPGPRREQRPETPALKPPPPF